ncbi:MAG: HAD-IIB family hydrolase [Planctomycetales bacterium]|nr:HAD-IIB family hydrolase [Planctomycetales bacterium]
MSGFKRQEIADKIGRCIASVERYLALIRKTWRMELEGEHDATQDTDVVLESVVALFDGAYETQTTFRQFDALSRLTHQVGPSVEEGAGATVVYRYGPDGLMSVELPNDLGDTSIPPIVTTCEYDSHGRVAGTRVSRSLPTVVEHDDWGRQVHVGGQVVGEVDGLDRQVKETTDAGVAVTRYTANGLVAEQVDHTGVTMQFQYDRFGNVLQKVADSNGSSTNHYCYDAVGRLAEVRDVHDIVAHSEDSVLKQRQRSCRLPEFDRLIVTDLDNTLTGYEAALAAFIERLQNHEHVGFGITTGRRLDCAQTLIDELGLPRPDLVVCGTQLHYGKHLAPDRSWRQSIGYAWRPDEVRRVLDPLPGFFPQRDIHQSEFKVSYEVDGKFYSTPAKIQKLLREAGVLARVMMSHGIHVDVLPIRGGSEFALRHVLWKWGFAPEHVLVAGSSGNDAGMLLIGTLSVVVGNHSEELEKLRNSPRVYFSDACHAAGILDGIAYYNFLDKIIIPNDRIE